MPRGSKPIPLDDPESSDDLERVPPTNSKAAAKLNPAAAPSYPAVTKSRPRTPAQIASFERCREAMMSKAAARAAETRREAAARLLAEAAQFDPETEPATQVQAPPKTAKPQAAIAKPKSRSHRRRPQVIEIVEEADDTTDESTDESDDEPIIVRRLIKSRKPKAPKGGDRPEPTGPVREPEPAPQRPQFIPRSIANVFH